MNNSRPILDNTTQDWSARQGQERDGWTAVQLKRSLDTCDPMDFPIKVRNHSPNAVCENNLLIRIQSGTNIIIFAYGLVDLDINRPEMDITYHTNRRNTRLIPLRSYADPPAEGKFLGLDTFEFRLNNVRPFFY